MKRAILVFSILMICFTFAGCDLWKSGADDTELTDEDLRLVSEEPVAATSGNSVQVIQTLSIYTIDSISESLVPLKVPITVKNITPGFVMDEVIKNLDEKIEVTEIKVEKSRIYITFNDLYVPIKKCSRKFETLLLDCVSNSLLDNLNYIDEVVFYSGDEEYRSDNYHFKKNEVYSSR